MAASQGERKRDEERLEGTGKEEPITSFPSPWKPKRLFHCLYTELLRELLAEEKAEKYSTCTFFKSQDSLALDVCGVPKHAHENPSDTYTIFSFCMLQVNLLSLVFVLLLTEVYLTFGVSDFQIS